MDMLDVEEGEKILGDCNIHIIPGTKLLTDDEMNDKSLKARKKYTSSPKSTWGIG